MRSPLQLLEVQLHALHVGHVDDLSGLSHGVQEAGSAEEKPLYGAVLDLMLRWTQGEDDAVRKILRSATESKGLNSVQIVESIYGSMENLNHA